jgi:hypothetical protein
MQLIVSYDERIALIPLISKHLGRHKRRLQEVRRRLGRPLHFETLEHPMGEVIQYNSDWLKGGL